MCSSFTVHSHIIRQRASKQNHFESVIDLSFLAMSWRKKKLANEQNEDHIVCIAGENEIENVLIVEYFQRYVIVHARIKKK